MIRIALLALLSTACATSVTVRLGHPDPTDVDYTRPAVHAAPAAPAPLVKPPVKKAAKKKPAPKAPTADTCKAKHEEADACDAAVKVETCKAACEPPAAASTPVP